MRGRQGSSEENFNVQRERQGRWRVNGEGSRTIERDQNPEMFVVLRIFGCACSPGTRDAPIPNGAGNAPVGNCGFSSGERAREKKRKERKKKKETRNQRCSTRSRFERIGTIVGMIGRRNGRNDDVRTSSRVRASFNFARFSWTRSSRRCCTRKWTRNARFTSETVLGVNPPRMKRDAGEERRNSSEGIEFVREFLFIIRSKAPRSGLVGVSGLIRPNERENNDRESNGKRMLVARNERYTPHRSRNEIKVLPGIRGCSMRPFREPRDPSRKEETSIFLAGESLESRIDRSNNRQKIARTIHSPFDRFLFSRIGSSDREGYPWLRIFRTRITEDARETKSRVYPPYKIVKS